MKRFFLLFAFFLFVLIVNYLIQSYIDYGTYGFSLYRYASMIVTGIFVYQLIKRSQLLKKADAYFEKNKIEDSVSFLVIAGLTITIFVLCDWGADEINKRLLANNYQALSAEILSCDDDHCVCGYEVNDYYYEHRINDGYEKYQEGDTIEIIYYRENPNVYEIVN